jgi:hypothetical protein
MSLTEVPPAVKVYAPRTDARPTSKQTWMIAHLLCETAGIPYPETRAEMSALISRLMDAKNAPAAPAPSTTDDIPF